ncbi:MAG TPA: hypothetical protein VG738_22335 [Chitinophagaceae bacterium]|nr:hypothetical protein [Chitinophagaceae bacterium]
MKKIICATAIACLVFTAAFSQANKGFSFSRNSDGRETKSVIESDNNDFHLKVEYTGDITLNDSETAIESISPGGILKYTKNGSRLIAESRDGVIYYQLYDNGEELSQPGEKATKFIAAVMKDLISLGFNAQQHVARIYKRGGASAVLAEVSDLKSDYVKQVYLGELLKIGNLNTADMNAVAKSIALLSGNYEKSQLLQKNAGAYLNNPQTIHAYFDAAGTIGGDYEKSQVLQGALKQQLTTTALNQLLAVAATIGSDYEKSQVLQGVLKGQPGKAGVSQLLAVAATIRGDYEKGQVLKKAARVPGLDEDNCIKLLNDADAIHGAYEKAGVLNEVIAADSLSNTSLDLLLQVAGRISSDYEKSGVFKALAARASWSTGEWIKLINATASVNAAYEKSTALVTIAGKMPADTKVREAYMETAKTIGSNYEYEQAVNAAK